MYSAVHINDQLVHEASLCRQKEMLEHPFELMEDRVDYLVLHLRRYVLVEMEFFND